MQTYPSEFVLRFNRRKNRFTGFATLLNNAMQIPGAKDWGGASRISPSLRTKFAVPTSWRNFLAPSPESGSGWRLLVTPTARDRLDLSQFNIARDIDYMNKLPKLDEEYDEFGQGYWKNISLINSSGEATDTQYRNADRWAATEHLNKCPEIKRLIETCFRPDHLKMVRARNLIAGMVIPHRDFVELDPKQRSFRIFVPIERNTDSFHELR